MKAIAAITVATTLLIQGCDTPESTAIAQQTVKRELEQAKEVEEHPIPAKYKTVEYEEHRLVEIEYNGTAHLYLQSKWGDNRQPIEVGTRSIR